MGCPGGCVNGGGQPQVTGEVRNTVDVQALRASALYANDAAKDALGKDFVGEGETISPMFLMSEYFRYAGLEGSAYMNYVQDLRDEYSVFNVAYVKKGDEYIPNDSLDVLKELDWVQYYMKNQKRME